MNRDLNNLEQYIKFAYGLKETVGKDDLICDLCQGKDVLDLGCIDHDYERKMGDQWLHRRLKKVAATLTGVDILSDAINRLNAEGFNIIEANAETLDLGKEYDVVVAGDLIEHVSNVGQLLTSIAKHLRDDGICIITTPNPFNIEQTMLALVRNRISVNTQHASWLDPRVLHQAISRSNLEMTDFRWVETRFRMPLPWPLFPINLFSRLMMRLRPICRRDFAVILKRRKGI
ncbi:MAG: class I SAM-dependent methyltransferase [Parcubacteria group bacterium]